MAEDLNVAPDGEGDSRTIFDDLTVLSTPASNPPPAAEQQRVSDPGQSGMSNEMSVIHQGELTFSPVVNVGADIVAAAPIQTSPGVGTPVAAADVGPSQPIAITLTQTTETAPQFNAALATGLQVAVGAVPVVNEVTPVQTHPAQPTGVPAGVTGTAAAAPAIATHVAVAETTTAAATTTIATQTYAAPELTVGGAQSGPEDSQIPLNISVATLNGAGDVLTITLSDVPSGSVLRSGDTVLASSGNGTYVLTQGELSGLTIQPPLNNAHDFTLGVTVTSIEGGSVSSTMPVEVIGRVYTPTLTETPSSGLEDNRVQINLQMAPNATDDSLTGLTLASNHDSATSAALADSHFTLGNGTAVGTYANGVWSFTAAEVAEIRADGLYVQAPANWNDYSSTDHTAGLALTATLTAQEVDPDTQAVSTASSSLNFNVDVKAVADTPVVTASAASGTENTAINLAISAPETIATEHISQIVISGVPSGAVLNHGSENADGTWTLTSDQLSGLTITPPADSAANFTLTVVSTSTEDGSGSYVAVANADSAPVTLQVTVTGEAQTPSLTQGTAASGNEDSRIALNLTELAHGADNSLSQLTITSHNDAATASALGSSVFTLGDSAHTVVGTYANGEWTFTAAQVAEIQTYGLYVQAPANWNDWNSTNNTTGLALTATLTAQEVDPDTHAVSTASSSLNLNVNVLAVADAPTVTTANASGTENSSIPLSISVSQLTSVAATQTISSIVISGVPSGATLNHGSENADGTWSLTTSELSGLKITPPLNSADNFTLTVTATSTEDGSGANYVALQSASTEKTFTVTVLGHADTPSLTQSTVASGLEDTPIALNLSEATTASDNTLTGMTIGVAHADAATLAALPGSVFTTQVNGQSVQVGTYNSTTHQWDFSATEVSEIQTGGLYVQAPANWNDWNSTSHTTGLALTATLTAQEVDPDTHAVSTATKSLSFDVGVLAVADAPAVTVQDASGSENSGIALSIDVSQLTSVAETQYISSVVISGLPDGATLSQGTLNSDGHSYTLTVAELSGLKVIPEANSNADFTLTVTATSTEHGNAAQIDVLNASTSETLHVQVVGQAEAPTFVQLTPSSGYEDTLIPLNLHLASTNPSDSLSLSLSGFPAAAHFYADAAGTIAVGSYDSGTGTWTFSSTDMQEITASGNSLYFLPPLNQSDWNTIGGAAGDSWSIWDPAQSGFHVTGTLTQTDTDVNTGNITAASSNLDFTVHVTGVPDMPAAAVAENGQTVHVSVNEDGSASAATGGTVVDLGLSQMVMTDTDGSEHLSVVLTVPGGLPSGAYFEILNSTDQPVRIGSNSWTVSEADIANVRLVLPSNYNSSEAGGDINVKATFTDTEVDGARTTTSTTYDLTVNPVTDYASIGPVQSASVAGNTLTLPAGVTAPSGSTDGYEGMANHLVVNVAAGGIGETITAVQLDFSALPSGTQVYDHGALVYTAGSNDSASYATTAAALSSGEITLTPPAYWSGYNDGGQGLAIGVSVTSEDHGATALTTTQTVYMTIAGVAMAPTLSALPALTIGDNATHSLNIAAHSALVDKDGSEQLWAIVTGVPQGALLTDHSGAILGYNVGNGTWEITPGQWAAATASGNDICITVPSQLSATSATLTVTLMSQEKDDGSTAATATPQTIALTLDGTAGGGTGGSGGTTLSVPTLTSTATGNEDTAISLNLAEGAHASSVVTALWIDGASLHGGTLSGYDFYDAQDNRYLVSEDHLSSLTYTPPLNWNSAVESAANLTLDATLVATSTSTGQEASASYSIPVTVTPVADTPTILLNGGSTLTASGTENQAIALNLGITAGGIAETIQSVTLSEVPSWAQLTYTDGNGAVHTLGTPSGSDTGAGASMESYDLSGLSASELASLKLVVPSYWSSYSGYQQINLSLSVVENDHNVSTSTTVKTIGVEVTPEAYAATITMPTLTGVEDTWIDLSHITVATSDISQGLSLVISAVDANGNAVPGFILNNGTNNGDGTWTVNGADVSSLACMAARDYNGAITLKVEAITWANGGDGTIQTSSASETFTITPVANTPMVTAIGAAGSENGSAIALSITATDPHNYGSDYVDHVVITGVPGGAHLNHGMENADGSWTLSAADLSGLTVTPAANDPTDFSLTVVAYGNETGAPAMAASAAVVVPVSVQAVALTPTLSQTATAVGAENGGSIALNLAIGIQDTAHESLTMVITGAPAGSEFFANGHEVGSYDATTGLYNFSAADMQAVMAAGGSLSMTPPANYSDWDTANHGALGMTASLAATNTDPDTGVSLTAGAVTTLTVDVQGVALAPVLTTTATAATTENTAASLSISAVPAHSDGSDAVSYYTISGVPTGATLNHGSENADGSWTVQATQISGLTVTPASNDAHDFTLTVSATAVESNSADAAVISATSADQTIHVTVTGTVSTPTVTESAASIQTDENTLTALNLTPHVGGTADSYSITLTGVVAGSHFYADANGGTVIGSYTTAANGTETWTFTSAEIGSGALYIQPPTDWTDYLSASQDSGMSLSATVTAYETDPDTSHTVSATSSSLALTLHVAGDAHTPTLTVADASGTEGAPIAVSITPAITAQTATESISSVTITGVPDGVTLSAGTHNSDGSWTLTSDQWAGLTLTPTVNAADFTMTVTATSSVLGGGTAVDAAHATAVSASETIHVTVTGTATPDLTQSAAASGDENTPIALHLSELAGASGDTLTGLVIAAQGGDAATTAALASASFITEVNGVSTQVGHYDSSTQAWDFTQAEVVEIQAGGLYVQAPQDWNDYNSTSHDAGLLLSATLTAQSTDPDTSHTTTASNSLNFAVHVAGVAEAPTLTVANAVTAPNDLAALHIATAATDLTGTEALTVTLGNVPTGALFYDSLGHLVTPVDHVVGGSSDSWTFSQSEVSGGLNMMLPSTDLGTYTLTVTSTSTEMGTNVDAAKASASESATLAVTVLPSADAAGVTAAGTVAADSTSSLNLAVTQSDAHAGITGILIDHLSSGISLSGTGVTHNADGSYSIAPADLGQVKIDTGSLTSGTEVHLQMHVTLQDGSAVSQTAADLGIMVGSGTAGQTNTTGSDTLTFTDSSFASQSSQGTLEQFADASNGIHSVDVSNLHNYALYLDGSTTATALDTTTHGILTDSHGLTGVIVVNDHTLIHLNDISSLHY